MNIVWLSDKFKMLLSDPKLFFMKLKKKLKKPPGSTPPKQDKNNFNPYFPYTHLIHTGENITGLSHLDLWIGTFMQSGVDFAIMVRNYELFKATKKAYPAFAIVYARGEKEVRYYLEAMQSLKACFYPSNTGNNIHPLAYNHMKHIFIGHGDSDKTASAHKFFRVYDENWVAGQAHIDRFANAGFDSSGLQHVIAGRPNLKETLRVANEPWRNRFGGELRLLYLSTWEGHFKEHEYTSVYILKDICTRLKDDEQKINIKIKNHPFLGRRDNRLLLFNDEIKKFSEEMGATCEVYGKEVLLDRLIMESNIFICDISAVVSESLAANAPIFVYIPKDKEIKLSASKMSYEDYCYTFSNVDELMEKMKSVLGGDDYLAPKREEAMEYILGRNETLDEQFIHELKRVKQS